MRDNRRTTVATDSHEEGSGASLSRLGLTEQEAARRLRERGPTRRLTASRSYASIVRHNVFTLPNSVLGFFGIVTVALGELADALFLGVVVANVAIGCTQEIRAKRALERLAALVAPTARVVRDGSQRIADVEELVVGDLVALGAGDQVVADGELVTAESLRLDESILTGESWPVRRGPGETVLSGSFAVEGAGSYVATAVGEASYAERLTGEARAFRHPPSPFQLGMNRLIVSLVALGVPLCVALSLRLWLRGAAFDEALPTVVAAVITLVPEGLILLGSIVYLSGALKLARHGALTQQLNAIESLAAADLVCFDKTGTLTEPHLRVAGVVPAAGVPEQAVRDALGRLAVSFDTRNAVLDALAEAFPVEEWVVEERIPFSSAWRFSAVRVRGEGLVLGAPDLFDLGALRARAEREAAEGRRVVAVLATGHDLKGWDTAAGPPPARPLGLAILSERLRPDAATTIGYFRQEEIGLLVLSGDAPATVASIAREAGIGDGRAVDARDLPDDDQSLAAYLRNVSVVGRIDPEGKRRVLEALRRSGRYTAMVGDGVNDVPALKASRIAIAQGSGSQMARAVADIVLVRGDFAAVPGLVAEGRQILRNLQRVSKIYATKCLFGALVVLGLGLSPLPFPFLPRQLSLASFFVTGVPPFFLALAPSAGPWQMTSFIREVARFAVPAAISVTAGVAAAYALAYEAFTLGLEASRTIALSVFIVGALTAIFTLEATDRRRAGWVGVMCVGLVAVYAVVFAVVPLRELFRLEPPSLAGIGLIALGVGVAAVGLALRFRYPKISDR
jgi:P-type E1-E2 ATPase